MAVDIGLKEYPASPYVNDGGFNALYLVLATSFSMMLAVIAGTFLSFIGTFFSLIFLFPVLLAICLGVSNQWILRAAHVRSRFACVLAASVVALTAVASLHVGNFAFFRLAVQFGEFELDSVKAQFAVANTPDEKSKLARDVADFERAATVENFFDYVKFAAARGIHISSAFSEYTNRITGKGVYIYWLLEAFLIVGYMTTAAYARGSAPYCCQCKQWKDKKRFGALPADPTLVSSIIEAGLLQDLPNLPLDEKKQTVVSGYACPHCEFGYQPVIAVDAANRAKQPTGEISRTVLTNEAALVLRYFVSGQRVAPRSTLQSEELMPV